MTYTLVYGAETTIQKLSMGYHHRKYKAHGKILQQHECLIFDYGSTNSIVMVRYDDRVLLRVAEAASANKKQARNGESDLRPGSVIYLQKIEVATCTLGVDLKRLFSSV